MCITIPEEKRRSRLFRAVEEKMPSKLFKFAIQCIHPNPEIRPHAKDFPLISIQQPAVSFNQSIEATVVRESVNSEGCNLKPQPMKTPEPVNSKVHDLRPLCNNALIQLQPAETPKHVPLDASNTQGYDPHLSSGQTSQQTHSTDHHPVESPDQDSTHCIETQSSDTLYQRLEGISSPLLEPTKSIDTTKRTLEGSESEFQVSNPLYHGDHSQQTSKPKDNDVFNIES